MIQHCGDGLLLRQCCIYRVPITLRCLKEKAYNPALVSIGPFHHGNKKLQDMERHKQALFKRFTQRAMSSLEDLVRLVKDLGPEVRASYSDNINLTDLKLEKLTLLDAGFIIELFFMHCHQDVGPKDAKLSQQWLWASICEDLLLHENQLPFFLIEKLFNKAFPLNYSFRRPSFLELTYNYFAYYNLQELKPNPHNVKIKHFTDLLRFFYLKENMPRRHSVDLFSDDGGDKEGHTLLYNANKLHEAGIKLKARKGKCLLDLKLSGHTLEIPQILVEDRTECLFRNMIALEQCHYPSQPYITDYALTFDYLIDTYKDVDLLVDKKIVSNNLGYSKNVASLFNGLGTNVLHSQNKSEYIDITRELNKYCKNSCNQRKATLRRDYCNTPWRTAASIAGIILLVLTIVQTIFSVLQVVLKM